MFSLNGKNIRQLSKEVNMTTSHLSNVTDQWRKEGIVTKEKKGRETVIKTTEVGKELIEVMRKYDEIATNQLNKIKNKGEDQSPSQDQGTEKKEDEGEN